MSRTATGLLDGAARAPYHRHGVEDGGIAISRGWPISRRSALESLVGCPADGGGPAVKAEATDVMEVSGVYREIKRPAKLVYTWSWEPKKDFGESVVTVDFLDKEGFTEVQITHDRLPNGEAREKHSHGWNGCLDKLEKEMAGKP